MMIIMDANLLSEPRIPYLMLPLIFTPLVSSCTVIIKEVFFSNICDLILHMAFVDLSRRAGC